MLDNNDGMQSWCIEKATHVVESLASAVDAINNLSDQQLEDAMGRPTEMGILVGDVYSALRDATKLLSYHVGVQWSPTDSDAIRVNGIAGYARVAARYGLTLPPPSANMAEDDPRRLVVRTAWIFYDEATGWGWMYAPDFMRDPYEQHAVRRAFPSKQHARASALALGFLVADIPSNRKPLDLGSLARYVHGNAYPCEQIAAFNTSQLAEDALQLIPDGAQVSLIGVDGGTPIVRYQGQDVSLSHDIPLLTEPPQRAPDAFQLLLWDDMLPIIAHTVDDLKAFGFRDYELAAFDLDRPIVQDSHWNDTIYHSQQQRDALAIAVRAVHAYIAGLPNEPSVVISGPIGSGKTHLSFAIALAAASSGLVAGYIMFSQLPMFEWQPSGLHTLAAYRDIDVLVLDDFFYKENQAPYLFEPVQVLIAHRKAHQRPTVITSAIPFDRLPEDIREGVTEIVLPLSDHRLLRQDRS